VLGQVVPKLAHGVSRQVNRADVRLGLGRPEHHRALGQLDLGLLNSHQGAQRVHVFAPQSEHLSPTQPAPSAQCDSGTQIAGIASVSACLGPR